MKKLKNVITIFSALLLSVFAEYTNDFSKKFAASNKIQISTTNTVSEKEKVMIEEIEENKYIQIYPTQDYQKAYAKLLYEKLKSKDEILDFQNSFLIHINADTTPELMVCTGSEVEVYSYDGYKSYYVGKTKLGYYSWDIRYCPYLSIVSYDEGSVNGTGNYQVYQLFEEIDGHLVAGKRLLINSGKESYGDYSEHYHEFFAPNNEYFDVLIPNTYQELQKYFLQDERTIIESWKNMKNVENNKQVNEVTLEMIYYWMKN